MAVHQSIVAKTETSLTIHWSQTGRKNNSQLSYSIDNGATWSPYEQITGVSGDYTVTGLSANTTYQIKTSVEWAGAWDTSPALAATTEPYPYASSMPDFVLGNTLTIGIYNPLNREFVANLKDQNGTIITNIHRTGTTATFFPTGIDWSSEIAALYASIPNAMSANYSVEVITDPLIDPHAETRTGGLYRVDEAASAPIIGSLTYADNSAAAAITGDNSQIVQNISTPLYTASGLTGRNSATIATCAVTVNGDTYTKAATATTTIQGGTINAAANIIATLTLTDSRGLTATATVEVQMVAWSNPTGIITVARQQNFYTETNVKVDADFTQIGTSAVTITLTGDAVPIPGKTTPAQVVTVIPDNVATVVNFDNEFEWNIAITLVDSFGGTTTYTGIHIGRGVPINFTDRILRSYAVNGFPTHENSIEVFEGSFYKDGVDIAALFPFTQYNDHDDGALTADTTKTKTYTVTGNGIVMASASMMSNGSSWGFERVAIELNNNIIAEGSDAFTSNYAGQYGASCSAFLIVTTGDVITLTCRSNRYAAGNTYDAYYNVLALGCTLS